MVIYGKQPVLYALERHINRIEKIFIAKELPKNLFVSLKKYQKPISVLDSKKAQALAHGRNHQGIFAQIRDIEPLDLETIKNQTCLLALCGVSDVGNIGSIMRSAYCLGVGGVLVCDYTLSKSGIEGMIRASAGAALDMQFCNIAHTLEALNELKMAGFVFIGADSVGENITSFLSKSQQNSPQMPKNFKKIDRISHVNSKPAGFVGGFPEKWILFLGSEGEGLQPRILKKMDITLRIPMRRDFDSLNVAHAAVIFLDRLLNRG